MFRPSERAMRADRPGRRPRVPGQGRPSVTSLVFPAYNPGPAVERTFAAVGDFLRARPDPWEILFVLDGCTDGTDERLAELTAEAGDPRIRVLAHRPNRGKGYAVRAGLRAARGHFRIF